VGSSEYFTKFGVIQNSIIENSIDGKHLANLAVTRYR
jgi:hypothetical protein